VIKVGLLKIDIQIPEAGNLKEKRHVLKGIKDRIRQNFNVSVAEVDQCDKWQLASLGVSCVANDKRYIDQVLSKVKNLLDDNRHIVVLDYATEIL